MVTKYKGPDADAVTGSRLTPVGTDLLPSSWMCLARQNGGTGPKWRMPYNLLEIANVSSWTQLYHRGIVKQTVSDEEEKIPWQNYMKLSEEKNQSHWHVHI